MGIPVKDPVSITPQVNRQTTHAPVKHSGERLPPPLRPKDLSDAKGKDQIESMKAASIESRKATGPLSVQNPSSIAFLSNISFSCLIIWPHPAQSSLVDKASLTLGVILQESSCLCLPNTETSMYHQAQLLPKSIRHVSVLECFRKHCSAFYQQRTKKKGDQKYVKPICDLKGKLSFTLQVTSCAVMFTNKMLEGRVEITLPNHTALSL